MHFEQIPVAVVKKIAEAQESKKGTARPANVTVEPSSRKTEPYSMPALSLDRSGLSPYRPSHDVRPFMLLGSDSVV